MIFYISQAFYEDVNWFIQRIPTMHYLKLVNQRGEFVFSSLALELLPVFPYLLFLTRVNVQLDMESSQ